MSDLIADHNFEINKSITRVDIGLSDEQAKKKLKKLSKQLGRDGYSRKG